MQRNSIFNKKDQNTLIESINKRNYSANVFNGGKSKEKRIVNNFASPLNNYNPYNKEFNLFDNYTYDENTELKLKQKPNNLEKFLFLNQQFKENDIRKKNLSSIRKITSAEPNALKTKLSQKFGKTLHEPIVASAKVKKENKSNIYKEANIFTNKLTAFNKFNINSDLFKNIKQDNYANTGKLKLPVLNNKRINNISDKPYMEYFVQLLQNHRDSMEDFHLIDENFSLGQSIFGVFDGHGGIEVAKKLKDEMGIKFSKILKKNNQLQSEKVSIENCINTLFKTIDEDVIKKFHVNIEYESTNFQSLGSTCTFLYLIKEPITKEITIYSANIGDSRGVIISKSGVSRITYDHKPSDDFENKRVKSSGGAIFGGKVFGQFSLTRAFGNVHLKKWVISEPFIKKIHVNENDRFVVIASDGIWDVVSDEECFEISIKYSSSKNLCEELVNTALSRWSKDNISCIAIKLN